MSLQPKYPQKALLPKIASHEQLPSDATEIARIYDRFGANSLLMFVKACPTLILLTVSIPGITRSGMHGISQFEVPMGFLPWFADALNEFRKPPVEGGLHAGAMTSVDQEVEGEMLCIQRSVGGISGEPGYVVVNRSRPSRHFRGYHASHFTFPDNFLFDGGLLKLIAELGEKYKKGLL